MAAAYNQPISLFTSERVDRLRAQAESMQTITSEAKYAEASSWLSLMNDQMSEYKGSSDLALDQKVGELSSALARGASAVEAWKRGHPDSEGSRDGAAAAEPKKTKASAPGLPHRFQQYVDLCRDSGLKSKTEEGSSANEAVFQYMRIVPEPQQVGLHINCFFALDHQVQEGTFKTASLSLTTTNLRTCSALAIATPDRRVFVTHVNQFVTPEILMKAIQAFIGPHRYTDLHIAYWGGTGCDFPDHYEKRTTINTIETALQTAFPGITEGRLPSHYQGIVNRQDVVGMQPNGTQIKINTIMNANYKTGSTPGEAIPLFQKTQTPYPS